MSVSKQTITKMALLAGTYAGSQCGVGQYTKRLQEQLERQGVKTIVITTAGAPEDMENVYGIQHWGVSSLFTIRKIFSARQIKLFHLQYPTRAYARGAGLVCLVWLLCLCTRCHFVVTIHEYATYSWKGRLKIWLLALPARQIIVPVESFVARLRRLPFYHRKQIAFIPVGPNIEIAPLTQEERANLRRQHGIGPETCLVGFWGYLEPSKGLETLLAAFYKVQARNDNLRLGLFSALDPLQEVSNRQEFINRAYRAKIKDFLLHHIPAAKIYQPADYTAQTLRTELALVDVFVLPFTEGASSRRSTLISVINSGMPVISTQGEQTEQILQSLWLVRPNDVEELSVALEKVCRTPVVLDELRRQSQKAKTVFAWENISRQHVLLYSELNSNNK